MKPFFTDKSKTCNKIILNENDKTIKDGKEIANKFNKYFANIIKKLNLKKDTGTPFRFQERMIKVFTEDAVAHAIKNPPTDKASVLNDIDVSFIPQKSILGSVLFNLYVAELADRTYTKTIQYANDTTLYRHCKISTLHECVFVIQKEVEKLLSWSQQNNLIFSCDKLQSILFSRHD